MLKTWCGNCCFKKPDGNYCGLHKCTHMDDKGQFLEGFCKEKRSYNWAKDKSGHLNIIAEEEKNLTVFIISDNNIDKIRHTLNSIKDENVTNVVVSTVNLRKSGGDYKELFELLDNSGFEWNLDDILSDEPFTDFDTLDYSIRLLKNHWFYTCRAGDDVNEILSMNYMNDVKNCVLFYKDKEDPLHILTNRFVFSELAGNYKTLFFDKIKAFENWEYVCHPLE